MPGMYLCIQSAVAAAVAALCCNTAAVRHCLPDGKSCCWFIESDPPSVFFLFIQTRFIFDVPLGSTVVFSASIFFT